MDKENLMRKIASFEIDHDNLEPGFYVSRIDGDIVSYDLRMYKPNEGTYLDNASMHTIEHTIATILRNSEQSENVIYFGPMGCRTGYYLLLRDELGRQEALDLIKYGLEELVNFSGEVPGSKRAECGNYLNHDLPAAKKEAQRMLDILEDYTVEEMDY